MEKHTKEKVNNGKRDLTCIADNMVFPADPLVTGINLNEMVVGPTGCGKTMSVGIPRLLHTYDSSIVIPIAKGSLLHKFSKVFAERGYKVEVIDFANPEKSTIGYDPLDYVVNDEDAIQLAKAMVETRKEGHNSVDPFWDNTAESTIASIILLLIENERQGGEKATLADVVDVLRNMEVDYKNSGSVTSIDPWFEALDESKPGNQASLLWKSFSSAPEKTASTIYTCVNNAIDKFMTAKITDFISNKKRIDFRTLGEEKTVLFIKTSPMTKTLYNFINIMYTDMFRSLFEVAESKEDSRLDVPVHIVCDDFACGSRILDFENYISIFREAGISVTLLLQSESQLYDMYGEGGGKTIINNCDTYIYMGGMDYDTCFNISRKINKPLEQILALPKEQVIVFRHGMQPKFAARYKTLEDPEYIRVMEES